MTTPFHHFKNPYRSIGVGNLDSCRFGEFYGWLGSGIKDKNRVEIYEGDIVILDNQRGVVRFANAQFYIDRDETEDVPFTLNSLCSPFVEVVGHIAEEQL